MTSNPNDHSNPQSDNRMNTSDPYPRFSNDPHSAQGYQGNQPPNYPHQPVSPIVVHSNQQQGVGTLCPSCNKMTQSYTKKDIGTITWIWCLGLWIFTGICCWIPFVCDDCKENQVRCAGCHFKKAVI